MAIGSSLYTIAILIIFLGYSGIGQFAIGQLYAASQSMQKAFDWYRIAAGQGLLSAQNKMGWMYANGYGVKTDFNQAYVWYRRSANEGDADAQYQVGWICEKALEVCKDKQIAIGWYRKAAKQGNPEAKAALKRLGVDSAK